MSISPFDVKTLRHPSLSLEVDRAMARGNMYWICISWSLDMRFWDMRADRRIDMHTFRQTDMQTLITIILYLLTPGGEVKCRQWRRSAAWRLRHCKDLVVCFWWTMIWSHDGNYWASNYQNLSNLLFLGFPTPSSARIIVKFCDGLLFHEPNFICGRKTWSRCLCVLNTGSFSCARFCP